MLYCFLSSFVGNVIIKGAKSAYKFFIITSHVDEIEKVIFENCITAQPVCKRRGHTATRNVT